MTGLVASAGLVGDILGSVASWDFTFQGQAYFVPAFSSLYGSDHPRASELIDTSYFLFQPECSFRRFNVSGARPHRRLLSEQVLRRFAASGRPYPIETVTDWPKVFRYIKPVDQGDGPIVWWS